MNKLNMFLKRKEFILPSNFSGFIRIVYGENCGEKINSKDKTYKVPKDGIIVLSENDFYPSNYQFFYVKENKKIRIYETELLIENTPFPSVIFMQSNGNTKKGYHDYYVSIGKETINYNLFGENSRLDSLTSLKIEKCNGR